MKAIKIVSFILAIVITTVITSCGSNNEKSLIKECFSQYKTSILNKDGASSVQYVTQSTIEEYGKYLEWAKFGEKNELQNLSISNKLQVLLIKHRVPEKTILDSTGESIFQYAVSNGWIGEAGTVKTETGEINLYDNTAVADVVVDGKRVPVKFHFTKEDNQWKFNLVKLLKITNAALEMKLKERGTSEDQFITIVIESLSGRKMDESIWEPLISQ